MNHTERIAHIARQERFFTRSLVAEAIAYYLQTIGNDLAAGEWVELPGIGHLQVTVEAASGKLYAIQKDGRRAARKPTIRGRVALWRYHSSYHT
jgi:hypothetical protein